MTVVDVWLDHRTQIFQDSQIPFCEFFLGLSIFASSVSSASSASSVSFASSVSSVSFFEFCKFGEFPELAKLAELAELAKLAELAELTELAELAELEEFIWTKCLIANLFWQNFRTNSIILNAPATSVQY